MQIGVIWCNLVQVSATCWRLVQLGASWFQLGTDWCSLVLLGAD